MELIHFDVAVIGGGPSGMMAAGRAAECGARVILIEKNSILGKKLLITGKGRCNITNAETDIQSFVDKFGRKGKFLYPVLNAFGVEDMVRFFNVRGLKTRIERGRRVFPESERSADVKRILTEYLKENGVTVAVNTAVERIIRKGSRIEKIETSENEIWADKFIVCTGGLSYPVTGSMGQGLKWVKKLGHTVINPEPALVPVLIKESWVKELKGLNLKNIHISVYQGKKKMYERFGEASFTGDGMDGPIILDMSKDIGALIKDAEEKGISGSGDASIVFTIDLKPALEFPILDARLIRDFRELKNKMFKNSMDKLLPKKLIPLITRLSGIEPDKKANSITKDERKKLASILKSLTLHVSGLAGFHRAIITAGGVSLNEIEPGTMKSKIIENLFFAGEILDLDGPTGGYNLQVCWSTGYTAGQSFLLEVSG